ncbi:CopD family protein [Herbaspirillum sp. VT-16-41]|uniref:CopD family protein n=1 Tax=Herbaspirillum sp. VT-16-41 TaxID=1953765 RepID=UPI0009822CE7|nr:CopD family protein [Herbaspirillum sp. VT-16-41]ONN64955.1 hypothetical protein BTM36_19210 [Herbaspirillum sp. VT-16-41]
MNLSSLYPWTKAVHVLSAILFCGGVMAVSAFLWSIRRNSSGAVGVAAALRRWDHAVTTPAMIFVWTFGLGLALTGHWFNAPWLHAKLFLVVALSAAHGIQSGRLRRIANGKVSTSSPLLPMILISIVGITILAVIKPS